MAACAGGEAPTVIPGHAAGSTAPGTVLVRVLLLGAVLMLLFREYLWFIVESAVTQPQNAQAIAVPLLMGLLVWLRKADFIRAVRCGRSSPAGIVLIVAGIMAFAVATWPFNYLQIRLLTIVVISAGILLAAGGWPLLRRAVPLLLLLGLAIPIGTRYYARVIIVPETLTLHATTMLLDLLPGVSATLEGLDIFFERGGRHGVVALGEPSRGASLLLAGLAVQIFLVASRPRGVGAIVAFLLCFGPILLLSNLLRFAAWGVWSVTLEPDPWAEAPRLVTGAASIVLTALLTALVMAIGDALVVKEDAAPGTGGAGGTA